LYSLLCVPFSENRLIVSIKHPKNYIFCQSWSVAIDETGVFAFPETLLQRLDWKIGDEVDWIEEGNGTFTLTKINGTASEKNARSNSASRTKKRRQVKMGLNPTKSTK
jgi:bifunctional DNA-binding transcriptional regulator/antitoxin component of YhaV-PrlF toxin-antitoxin module